MRTASSESELEWHGLLREPLSRVSGEDESPITPAERDRLMPAGCELHLPQLLRPKQLQGDVLAAALEVLLPLHVDAPPRARIATTRGRR